jgi:hypothetical protein
MVEDQFVYSWLTKAWNGIHRPQNPYPPTVPTATETKSGTLNERDQATLREIEAQLDELKARETKPAEAPTQTPTSCDQEQTNASSAESAKEDHEREDTATTPSTRIENAVDRQEKTSPAIQAASDEPRKCDKLAPIQNATEASKSANASTEAKASQEPKEAVNIVGSNNRNEDACKCPLEPSDQNKATPTMPHQPRPAEMQEPQSTATKPNVSLETVTMSGTNEPTATIEKGQLTTASGPPAVSVLSKEPLPTAVPPKPVSNAPEGPNANTLPPADNAIPIVTAESPKPLQEPAIIAQNPNGKSQTVAPNPSSTTIPETSTGKINQQLAAASASPRSSNGEFSAPSREPTRTTATGGVGHALKHQSSPSDLMGSPRPPNPQVAEKGQEGCQVSSAQKLDIADKVVIAGVFIIGAGMIVAHYFWRKRANTVQNYIFGFQPSFISFIPASATIPPAPPALYSKTTKAAIF